VRDRPFFFFFFLCVFFFVFVFFFFLFPGLCRSALNSWNFSRVSAAPYKPLWIEEPTNCDDIVGHRAIAEALKPLGVGVATGEVAQNKVIFKQLLQEEAIEFCQIDSCRIAGPSEILSVLLMSAHFDTKVCPHAGGVGLGEYVRCANPAFSAPCLMKRDLACQDRVRTDAGQTPKQKKQMTGTWQ
jgi:L-alanine-DL-glutamate epimerase-like enolase superfamily enzyme